MKLKDYLEWKGVTATEAAKELDVTKARISQVCNGDPAGRKLADRIFIWTDGAVSREEAIYPTTDAA